MLVGVQGLQLYLKGAMSYMPVPQNYMMNMMRQPTMMMPGPIQHPLSTLKVLSQTLRKSIVRYQDLQTVQPPPKTTPCPTQGSNSQPKSEKEVVQAKRDDTPKESYFQIRKEKKREHDRKPVHVPRKPKREKVNTQLTTTQVSPEKKKQEVALSQRPRVSHSLPIDPRRDVSKPRKGSMYPTVPLVDLLDLAYLPSLGFSAKELKKKRDSLMRRQVRDWQGKQRMRGFRRELRMLGK